MNQLQLASDWLVIKKHCEWIHCQVKLFWYFAFSGHSCNYAFDCFSLLLDAVILGEPIALTKLEKIENNEDSLEKMICIFREKENLHKNYEKMAKNRCF